MEHAKRLQPGDSAPDFSLMGTDGVRYSLDSFKEKRFLLIVFSCNHCPYVRAYEDRLIALQHEFAEAGLQIAAINSNDDAAHPEDSFEAMVLRSKEKAFPFPYLRDALQETARSYSASFTPELFLFDENRALRYAGKIDDNWQFPDKVAQRYLADAITELSNNKPVSVPETYAIGCTIKWKS